MSHRPKARLIHLSGMLTMAASIVALIALVVIGAWWSHNLVLASVSASYVPMTLSVGMGVLILSFALLVRQHLQDVRGMRHVPLAVSIVVLAMAVWVLVDFELNTGFDLDKLLGGHRETLSGYVLAESSPISAITIIAAAACCVLTFCECLRKRNTEALVSVLALFVFSVGLLITLGYLYGTPLLYGGEVRPVALLAGVCYCLLGFALAVVQGPDRWPVKAFVGHSVRARLMRSFLPVIVIVVIVSGSLSNKAISTSGNPALEAALIALVTVVVVGYIIARLAASIGGEIDKANADLLEAREELRQANEKLTVLGSITRHDALNRLAVVLGRLELMSKHAQDPAMKKHVVESLSSAQAARSIIEFTGEYQNIGIAGPVWMDVEEAFREAIRGLDHDAVSTDSNVSGLEVLADEMFPKVLANLVDNSMRHGGHVSSIGLDREERDGRLVLIYTDDGVGLPDADRKNLFRRGFGKHTGLGMYLSREILLFTGITISETGVSGKGARFEIAVPEGKYRFKVREPVSPAY